VSSAIVPGLIDTGVMVAWARGHPPAILFVLALNRLGAPQLSQLSAMELLSGCQTDAERAIVLRFVASAQVVALTDVIAQRAVDLLTVLPLPTVLTPSDAIVAATAIEHSLPLYTLDPARFANVPGLAATRPY
jgi:predicted nucleic acid-binding protein